MRIETTIEGVRAARDELRSEGLTLALLPTMGFLHEGHLSLVDRGHDLADRVALSIFVNPTQFGPGEDLEGYPRDLERDRKIAEDRGVDLLFVPPVEEMYPETDLGVTVDPGPMAEPLCGAYRPGHFRGVLTVVAKLFGIFEPEIAVFGRKDYQQLALIRAMVDSLALPVRVEGAPIVREPDGLALSSRNRYLSESERKRAAALFRGLLAARAAFRSGEALSEALRSVVRKTVEAEDDFRLQYAEVVDPRALRPRETVQRGDLLAAAAHLGETRLIDNLILD